MTWVCDIPGATAAVSAWHFALHVSLAAIVVGAGVAFLVLAVIAYRRREPQLVVSDAAARAQLLERGMEASEVQDYPWEKFVFFSDPDGKGWTVQELPVRT